MAERESGMGNRRRRLNGTTPEYRSEELRILLERLSNSNCRRLIVVYLRGRNVLACYWRRLIEVFDGRRLVSASLWRRLIVHFRRLRNLTLLRNIDLLRNVDLLRNKDLLRNITSVTQRWFRDIHIGHF
jgi:hypothetical protein